MNFKHIIRYFHANVIWSTRHFWVSQHWPRIPKPRKASYELFGHFGVQVAGDRCCFLIILVEGKSREEIGWIASRHQSAFFVGTVPIKIPKTIPVFIHRFGHSVLCHAVSSDFFTYYWSNYRGLTRPHPKWGNLGWWNIIIWPDITHPAKMHTLQLKKRQEAWSLENTFFSPASSGAKCWHLSLIRQILDSYFASADVLFHSDSFSFMTTRYLELIHLGKL